MDYISNQRGDERSHRKGATPMINLKQRFATLGTLDFMFAGAYVSVGLLGLVVSL